MIRNVLTAPLDPSVPGLQLSAVSPACCLRELGFYFPLQPVTPGKLSRLFAGKGIPIHYPRQTERLNFMPAQGFMNGFMDLVFRFAERYYLIDWKSNLLGTNIANYGQDALKLVMEEDYYFLQYHLYVLALDQYLKLRLGDAYDYERHFGGVFYLFLRGVDPARGGDFGIYRDRPTMETIAALSQGLIKDDEFTKPIFPPHPVGGD
jgi:exodeoxyribonuclease V beta subunit